MLCPRCGATEWRRVMAKGGFEYVACSGCALTRLDPFPDDGSARTMYGDDYFAGAAHGGYGDYVRDAALHRRNGRARMRRLGSPDRRGDVFVTSAARSATRWPRRPQPGGPRSASTRTRRRAPPSLRPGSRSAPTGTSSAWRLRRSGRSASSSRSSTSPIRSGRSSGPRHLVAGGRLIIETWNRSSLVARLAGKRWQQATPPSVLWLFGRRDVEALLTAAGFDVRSYRRTSKWVSLGLVGSQMRARDGSGPLVRAALALERAPIPYALGDLVTVVAVRRGAA